MNIEDSRFWLKKLPFDLPTFQQGFLLMLILKDKLRYIWLFAVYKLNSLFLIFVFLFSQAAIYKICNKAQRIKSFIMYLIS